MKRLPPWLLLAATVVLAGALTAGWRNYAARRAWQAALPGLPAAAGDAAPGLDVRLADCMRRLHQWPPDRAALAEFTRLCHANGQLEAAMTGYRALALLDPNEARWPHLLASILAGYGRLDEALPLLRRTTVLAPDSLVAWLRLGDALLKSNATPEAEAAYQAALTRAPGNPFALLGLARCDLQAERWTAARSHLQQAVTGNPDFAGAQSLLASVFERLGNPEAAAVARARVQGDGHYREPPDPWSDELTAYCHNPYMLLVTASAATAEGTPRKALPALERALVLAPADARLHRQLAKVRSNLGDQAGARTELEKAVALAPADESMQADLLTLLRLTSDQATLEQAVARGLAAAPASAALQFEAGRLAAGAGRMDEAAQHFRLAWQNRPDEPAAARELAKIYFQTGREGAGIEVLEKILGQEPRDAPTHLLLVRHGIETGDQRTAVWLHRALEAGGPEASMLELQQAFQRRFGTN